MSFVTGTSASQTTGSTLNCTFPASISAGNLLLACQFRLGTSLPVAPTGFTLAPSGSAAFTTTLGIWLWYKVAVGSEAGALTFNSINNRIALIANYGPETTARFTSPHAYAGGSVVAVSTAGPNSISASYATLGQNVSQYRLFTVEMLKSQIPGATDTQGPASALTETGPTGETKDLTSGEITGITGSTGTNRQFHLALWSKLIAADTTLPVRTLQFDQSAATLGQLISVRAFAQHEYTRPRSV